MQGRAGITDCHESQGRGVWLDGLSTTEPSTPVTGERTWGAKSYVSYVHRDRAGFDGARESDSWTDTEFRETTFVDVGFGLAFNGSSLSVIKWGSTLC